MFPGKTGDSEKKPKQLCSLAGPGCKALKCLVVKDTGFVINRGCMNLGK